MEGFESGADDVGTAVGEGAAGLWFASRTKEGVLTGTMRSWPRGYKIIKEKYETEEGEPDNRTERVLGRKRDFEERYERRGRGDR